MAKSTKDLIKHSTKELTKLRALMKAYVPDLNAFFHAAQDLKTHAGKRPDDMQLLASMTTFDEARSALLSHRKPLAAQSEVVKQAVIALDEKRTRKELKNEFKKADRIETHLKEVAKLMGLWTDAARQFNTVSASAEAMLTAG